MADESHEPKANDELPPEMFSPLDLLAITTHETFIAFMRAGFKENHALALTMKTLELTFFSGQYEIENLQELDEDE